MAKHYSGKDMVGKHEKPQQKKQTDNVPGYSESG
jgi:hypothetical protein